MRKTIWYAGKELDFFIEVDSVDEGQDFLVIGKGVGPGGLLHSRGRKASGLY